MRYILSIISFILIIGCTPKLHTTYSYVEKRKHKGDLSEYSFSFNLTDSTFLYANKHYPDSIFGYFKTKGNKLLLLEYSRDFVCLTEEKSTSINLIFRNKFDSTELANYPVRINGNLLETDRNGLIVLTDESFRNHKVEITPILFKSYLISLKCSKNTFYVAPTELNDTENLTFRISKKFIKSNTGGKYYKVVP